MKDEREDIEFEVEFDGKDCSRRKERRNRKEKEKKIKGRRCSGDCENCFNQCEEYFLNQR